MISATKDIETAIAEAMKKYGLSAKECMLTCAMAILHVHNETEQTNKATSLKMDIYTPDGIYKTKAAMPCVTSTCPETEPMVRSATQPRGGRMSRKDMGFIYTQKKHRVQTIRQLGTNSFQTEYKQ
jgi:hypothetical protein